MTQSSFLSPHPSIWAIVPVKSLPQSKQRLAHFLSAAERADLIHRFLVRTLAILNQAPEIARTVVVSRDERALETARLYGADPLLETAPSTTDATSVLRASESGLNPAVTYAVQFAARGGATAVLILPADLPFIEREDVAIMVREKKNNPHVVICSDDKGLGTNALLISPPDNFSFHYGTDSFRQHLQEAQKHGRTISIIHSSNLQFDLDTEADWHNYQLTINRQLLTINHL